MAKKHNEPGKSTISEVTVKVEDTLAKEATAQPEATKEVAADEIPALPADFQQPTNPVEDSTNTQKGFPFNIDPAARFIQEGKFTPYRTFSFNNEKADLIVDKSNELARTIWPDASAYVKANETLSGINTNRDYTKEGFVGNRKFYDSNYLSGVISQALGVANVGSFGTPYLYSDKIDDIIRKLKRLERKNSNEEIFDDAAREQIINYILLPTNTTVTMHDRYAGLNLSYPDQKEVVNEILTKDEVNGITTILNYIPRVRKMLANCFEPTYKISKQHLAEKLTYASRDNIPTDHLNHPVYSNDGFNSTKKLEAMLMVHRFLTSAIPYDIIRDLAPGLAQSSNNMTLHSTNMYAASKSMREASLNYIREERGLGELLQKITEYSRAVTAYFGYVNSELSQLFDLLNRLDISYETLLNDSDEYSHNNVPW